VSALSVDALYLLHPAAKYPLKWVGSCKKCLIRKQMMTIDGLGEKFWAEEE